MSYDYGKLVRQRKEQEAAQKKDGDKNRLLTIITNKMRTTNIGDIAAVEKYFGFLWGHREYRELTPEEQDLKEKWEACRKEMLDKGNKQIRNIKEELELYTIEWNRYRLSLPVYREGRNGQG